MRRFKLRKRYRRKIFRRKVKRHRKNRLPSKKFENKVIKSIKHKENKQLVFGYGNYKVQSTVSNVLATMCGTLFQPVTNAYGYCQFGIKGSGLISFALNNCVPARTNINGYIIGKAGQQDYLMQQDGQQDAAVVGGAAATQFSYATTGPGLHISGAKSIRIYKLKYRIWLSDSSGGPSKSLYMTNGVTLTLPAITTPPDDQVNAFYNASQTIGNAVTSWGALGSVPNIGPNYYRYILWKPKPNISYLTNANFNSTPLQGLASTGNTINAALITSTTCPIGLTVPTTRNMFTIKKDKKGKIHRQKQDDTGQGIVNNTVTATSNNNNLFFIDVPVIKSKLGKVIQIGPRIFTTGTSPIMNIVVNSPDYYLDWAMYDLPYGVSGCCQGLGSPAISTYFVNVEFKMKYAMNNDIC